ncbi:penicillin-binding protein activator [Desulfovibrio sp. OttesenSCG-928-O18]|nr:penicillin-binding protein activator [Desulfovibrio sp. OttesenSCG-928-O18]
MTALFLSIRRRIFSCCLLAVCCLTLSGCFFGKTVIKSDPGRVPQSTGKTAPAQRLGVGDAEAAWNAGQAARAEQIATRLVAQTGLSPEDMARASRVLALSASANAHPYLAMTALERWRGADAAADKSHDWQSAFLKTLGQLPQYDAQGKAQAVMSDASRPFALRSGSALFLASRQWERGGQAPQALANIQAFYTQALDRNDKAQMEHALFAHLQNTDAVTLGNLDAQVTEENSKAYPHAIIRLEALRRKALHASTLDEAKEGAAILAEDTTLADPAILRSWDVPATPVAIAPISGKTLVLALPLSGSLGSIGKKIAAGAEEARKEFAQAGHSVGLVMLDTQTPDWMDKLASFPANASIVGGPLRMDVFTAAHARGLTRDRVFLTFMPGLGDAGEEGRIAWRFFPSAEDQLAALFSATRKLEITRYAIVMPDNDPYSARMADLFTAYVRAAGGDVVKRLEYPANEPEKWNKLIGSFLGTHKKANRPPSTEYRAIFLPDSWRNMELIVPNFFYFLESRQLLLGTSLWEQGLAATDHVAAHYYNLAVFPGAWNKTDPSQAGQQLYAAYARAGRGEPDFWAGLGYDFVRYASLLDIPTGWTAGTVNAALAANTGMVWSMAPITWTNQGKASQNLFLFSPTGEGFAPADLPAIEAGFNKAWRR